MFHIAKHQGHDAELNQKCHRSDPADTIFGRSVSALQTDSTEHTVTLELAQ